MISIKKLASSFSSFTYNKIIHEVRSRVGVIYLNSHADLNALSTELKQDLIHCLGQYEANPSIRVIALLSKVDKAFCAGANIKDFHHKTMADFAGTDIFEPLTSAFGRTTKPIISGVNGVALGGGCELALLTDIIVCSDNARFGLPELKLGLIPGIGGAPTLSRMIGKVNTMRYILTSDMISAARAYQLGIVSDVFPKEQLHTKTLEMAQQISEKPLPALIAAKSVIKSADDLTLQQGVKFERKVFYPLFNTKGTRQGIAAFVEKRKPKFDDE